MASMGYPLEFMSFFCDAGLQSENKSIEAYFMSPEYFLLSEALSTYLQERRQQPNSDAKLRQYITSRDFE